MTKDGNGDFDLDDLLFGYFYEQQEEFKKKNRLFAHYTSAEAAMKILNEQTIMFRNARLMNDFSEVEYGQDTLWNAWQTDKLGQQFVKFLNSIEDRLADQLEELLNEHSIHQRFETYIFSMIEHDVDDQKFGKLSMWRAYGGDSGIALVFDSEPLLDEHPNLYAFNTPVLYGGVKEIHNIIFNTLAALKRHQVDVQAMDKDYLVRSIAFFLHYLTLSTKHPGFREEREWRVIYSPTFYKSDQIEEKEKVLKGIPQTAHFLKLEKSDVDGWSDLQLSKVLKSLIIGPTQYPEQLYLSFVKRLQNLGFSSPGKVMHSSNIPLRKG